MTITDELASLDAARPGLSPKEAATALSDARGSTVSAAAVRTYRRRLADPGRRRRGRPLVPGSARPFSLPAELDVLVIAYAHDHGLSYVDAAAELVRDGLGC